MKPSASNRLFARELREKICMHRVTIRVFCAVQFDVSFRRDVEAGAYRSRSLVSFSMNLALFPVNNRAVAELAARHRYSKHAQKLGSFSRQCIFCFFNHKKASDFSVPAHLFSSPLPPRVALHHL